MSRVRLDVLVVATGKNSPESGDGEWDFILFSRWLPRRWAEGGGSVGVTRCSVGALRHSVGALSRSVVDGGAEDTAGRAAPLGIAVNGPGALGGAVAIDDVIDDGHDDRDPAEDQPRDHHRPCQLQHRGPAEPPVPTAEHRDVDPPRDDERRHRQRARPCQPQYNGHVFNKHRNPKGTPNTNREPNQPAAPDGGGLPGEDEGVEGGDARVHHHRVTSHDAERNPQPPCGDCVVVGIEVENDVALGLVVEGVVTEAANQPVNQPAQRECGEQPAEGTLLVWVLQFREKGDHLDVGGERECADADALENTAGQGEGLEVLIVAGANVPTLTPADDGDDGEVEHTHHRDEGYITQGVEGGHYAHKHLQRKRQVDGAMTLREEFTVVVRGVAEPVPDRGCDQVTSELEVCDCDTKGGHHDNAVRRDRTLLAPYPVHQGTVRAAQRADLELPCDVSEHNSRQDHRQVYHSQHRQPPHQSHLAERKGHRKSARSQAYIAQVEYRRRHRRRRGGSVQQGLKLLRTVSLHVTVRLSPLAQLRLGESSGQQRHAFTLLAHPCGETLHGFAPLRLRLSRVGTAEVCPPPLVHPVVRVGGVRLARCGRCPRPCAQPCPLGRPGPCSRTPITHFPPPPFLFPPRKRDKKVQK
eukprot:Hpha_TRINITY_DN14836_c0_g9::TRINITY_DN14836_c0_g9_i1::g.169947::m.169947